MTILSRRHTFDVPPVFLHGNEAFLIEFLSYLGVAEIGTLWYNEPQRTYKWPQAMDKGGVGMANGPKYFIVEAEALPEVFRRVAEAKRLLETGEAETVNAAAAQAGISRSAFYKYKDAVHPFNDMLHGRIVTFQNRLKDEPGVLSAVLNLFAQEGGNILTINQDLPVSGRAVVTITAETSELKLSLEEMIGAVSAVEGVLKCEILAG